MNIGIPKERRPFEFRVGMIPAGVQMLSQNGHTCYVEHDAGLAAGFGDLEYEKAGARIVYSPEEAFGRADLLLKVTRPLYTELEWIQPRTVIAGLLHLAATKQDKIELFKKMELSLVAYEQIKLPDGTVPVRRPLSQIGAAMAAQIAAHQMQNDAGGKGMLLGGIESVPQAEVVIIGAGVFGSYATRAFVGMGARVTVLDTKMDALARIYENFPCVATILAYPHNIAQACAKADVVVAAVLVPGERTPIVVTREMVSAMKPQSLIMDIAIDEGGCVETSRLTTHEHPTFVQEGVIHYCVPNIPSVVAQTSSYAFLNAAFPFINLIANQGIDEAISANPAIEVGTAMLHGTVKHMVRMLPVKE